MRHRPHLPRLLTAGLAAAAALTGLLAAATPATAAAATVTHTRTLVVRPVHRDGRPVAGYTVKKESIPGFQCTDVSADAVSPDIRWCGFSATYTPACWKSTHHTVLCLRNAHAKTLYRIRYTGRFAPVARPKHPMPLDMTLAGGNRCSVRDGGAWSYVIGHPNWYGTYSCASGDVYGRNDGIDERHQPWRVELVHRAGTSGQTISARAVRTAWFVGTAA